MNGCGAGVVSGRRAVCVRRVRRPLDRRAAEEGFERRCASGAVTVTEGIVTPCVGEDCAKACGLAKNAPEVISAASKLPAIPGTR
jgi:hypothetical protein